MTISFRLNFEKVLGLTLLLHIIHGVEVSQTDFVWTHPDFYPYTKLFTTIPEAVYYVQHGGIYICLLMIWCMVMGGRWIYVPLIIIGLLNISEIHHCIRAIASLHYTSGAITSFLFIPLSYMYMR